MLQYFFDKKNQFIIEDYHKSKTFSSFLPGVAGESGIPVWTFYVNRGQGISGFGIKNKDYPMMEFFPANMAYQYVSIYGFRTFIKNEEGQVIEPFNQTSDENPRRMGILKDRFFVEEDVAAWQIKIRVTYTTLAKTYIGGLIRRVEIINYGKKTRTFEVVDGMPMLLPYGTTNAAFKEMSNLVRSWMEVHHTKTKIPFYRLRASTEDEAEVSAIEQGYFFMNESVNDSSVVTIYDPKILFGYRTDLRDPIAFRQKDLVTLQREEQVSANKVPCAFQGKCVTLEPGQTSVLNSIYGYGDSYELISSFGDNMQLNQFVDNQFDVAETLVDDICSVIDTKTGSIPFDAYMKQAYLDNVLRGGKPIVFEGKDVEKIYHIYSRKHGDQERDYNFFSLEPGVFSQGNGNYRDMNQNRRHDLLFEPRVKDFNVWMFYNLVQTDGYNPLSVNGIQYVCPKDSTPVLLQELEEHCAFLSEGQRQQLMQTVVEPFTPGGMIQDIAGIQMETADMMYLMPIVLKYCNECIDVTFGEGFWSDHFTYNQDLIEDYLTIYPENREALLFDRWDYKYYNAPYYVLKREEKYGLTKAKTVRQYGSIAKKEMHTGNWMVDAQGKEVQVNLFNKMLTLVMTKFMNLDAFGMGIEMEGNKPGWNDALNGLPGLFGSGVSETVELLRIIRFLLESFRDMKRDTVEVLSESRQLIEALAPIVEKGSTITPYERWDALNQVKDSYRDRTRLTLDSAIEQRPLLQIQSLLEGMELLLEEGIKGAEAIGKGLLPSYFVHEAIDYELLDRTTPYGLQAVRIKAFEQRALPYFLEAPARYLKVSDAGKAAKIYDTVKQTDMFDPVLHMYKTSVSIEEETMEIGRIKAFTPGWLERESIFLHMTYKYLLGLLKSGAYNAFFEAMETNWIPYLKPEVYGRPTTENSSFLASSVNPDKEVVGQGFVARLSGSTAEALSIWKYMFVGKQWFSVDQQGLRFDFTPVLSKELFDERQEVHFTLLGKTRVTYKNKTKKDLLGYDEEVKKIIDVDGKRLETDYIADILAHALREGRIGTVKVTYEY